MEVGDASSKDRRRSSVSPMRERARRKPRQDWLVTVGQGRSPARTLRRESKGRRDSKSPRKFDSARLSFGGLEQVSEVRQIGMPCWEVCAPCRRCAFVVVYARVLLSGDTTVYIYNCCTYMA